MMVEQQTRDIMNRTIKNLEFISQRADRWHGPYEVTQLLNSVIGIFVHPWERRASEMPDFDPEALGWPPLRNEYPSPHSPTTWAETVTCLRHSFAHGNIEFLPDHGNDIRAIRVWNVRRVQNNPVRNWGTTLDIETLRSMLLSFAKLAEKSYDEMMQRNLPRAAD